MLYSQICMGSCQAPSTLRLWYKVLCWPLLYMPQSGFPSIRPTMKFMIWQLVYSQKSARWSLICTQSPLGNLLWQRWSMSWHFSKWFLGWSVWRLLLMQKFLIFMVQVIDPPMPRVFTEIINYLRNILMKVVSVRLSKVPLHLQFFSHRWNGQWSYIVTSVLLLDKWNTNYATVMEWVQYCLSFSLLTSVFQCLRGSKGHFGHLIAPVQTNWLDWS